MEGCGAQGGHGGPPHYKKTRHPIQWTMPPQNSGAGRRARHRRAGVRARAYLISRPNPAILSKLRPPSKRIPLYIVEFLSQLFFIADNSVEVLVLPDSPAPSVPTLHRMRGERLPRMNDLLERLVVQGSQQDVHMVVHDHVGIQLVALFVPMMQFRRDQIALRRGQFFGCGEPPRHEIDRVSIAVVWQASSVEVR